MVKIAYHLTAKHKRPIYKLSPTLHDVREEVEILDTININLPDYRVPVKMKNELGFVSGGKLTQWSCSVPRSAFVRGTYNLNEPCYFMLLTHPDLQVIVLPLNAP